MTARRQLAIAVVGCLAGAGLALFASAQTWVVEEGLRPVPLPPLGIHRSGSDLVPGVPALAYVALAGAGAILATRRRLRTVVGALVSFVGLVMIVLLRGALDNTDVDLLWVGLVAVGGLIVTAAGVLTLRNGARWPGLGARYERPAPAEPHPAASGPSTAMVGSEPPGGEPASHTRPAESGRPEDAVVDSGTRQHTAWWDAIDRGEDPTRS
jgi:hypothetical protein